MHNPLPSDVNRRQFLKSGGLATVAAALRVPISSAIVGTTYAQVAGAHVEISGKRGLRILSDRPLNAETPVTLLDAEITPTEHHFVRNNGHVPQRASKRDATGWKLTVDGELQKPLELSLDALKRDFPKHTRALVLECAGNGRAGFNPPASGNPWTLGGVGCALYTGVLLKDVLKSAGVKSSAVFVAYMAEDPHLSQAPGKDAISRGVPIAKALDEHTMLAWDMNGEPLHALHGWPLRLICPGWPASTSGKWLTRLWIRDREHDGTKMTGHSYRLPKYPVAPGTDVPAEDMKIIEELPVKSIITNPASGLEISINRGLELRGHAWSGSGDVTAMHVSHDFGVSWQPCQLSKPRNKYAWQRWSVQVKLPEKGYYEIWARATDHKGRMQPMIVPGWNPEGYCNNAMHRIAIKAT
jgi:DMSO/TMAO reductase YedYZ molybdopterin-dependent catalytic subunit